MLQEDKVSEYMKKEKLIKTISAVLRQATETWQVVKVSFDKVKMEVLPVKADEYASGRSVEEVNQRHMLNLIAFYERKKNYKNLKVEARQECANRVGAEFNEWMASEKFDYGTDYETYCDFKIKMMQHEYAGRVFIFAKRFGKMMQYLMKKDKTELTPQIVKMALNVARPEHMDNDTVTWGAHLLCSVWKHKDAFRTILKADKTLLRREYPWERAMRKVTGQSVAKKLKRDKQRKRES